ncbi:hypothetical protein M0R45_031353 [Rubus argutus]|uniref:DUF4283 domain-containing protein n=1 Tax=Rubus argutus TaxID=59490 RepID=A0AAW1WG55_RUBAR
MNGGEERSSVSIGMEEILTSFAKTLTLTAEEAEGISCEEEDDEVNDAFIAMSLVVRVYTDKPVHRHAFADRILELWQPVREVKVKVLAGGLFLFTFSVSDDKKKVIDFAPWVYDKAFVLLEEPDGNMAPSLMQLKHIDLWVQCHNLPLKKMSIRMGGAIGNKLGKFLEVDCDEFGACVGKFMRVKVRLDISKPLLCGFPIDLPSGVKALMEFRYEQFGGSDDEVQPPSDIDHNRSTTSVSIIPSREDMTVKKGFKHNSSNGSVENSSRRQKAGVSTMHKVVSNSALHHQILQVPHPSISAEEVIVKVPAGNANQKMVEDGPLKDKTLFGDFEVFVQEGVGRGSQSTSVGSEGNNVVIMQGRGLEWMQIQFIPLLIRP